MDVKNLYSLDNAMTFIANRLFITGIVVVAAFAINTILLKRETIATDSKKQIFNIFKVIVIVLAYIIPFIEIDIQLSQTANFDHYATSNFRYTVLATFSTIYIAVLGIVLKKEVSSKQFIFGLLYVTVLFYAIYYTRIVTEFRSELFYYAKELSRAKYFSIHFISLPAITYIIYLIIKNIKLFPAKSGVFLSWLLTVLVVVILSVETDHIVVRLLGHSKNYHSILHDVHTFGYPILWGVIAMALMIWGLNRKEALLRKISLVFFGIIILKFYAFDVWRMSQSGRIISFVLLGVILLLVSFLQQKIRTLVKNDSETENNEQNKISQ